ncbi:Circadian-associated transcriptional repressor [Dissostichus eleginoides]|uniref:Circadian-associated transcriptional repressor n=1 Tax=Dissostichus eleginoides TaxID=100907 RepID=A0AAD9BDT5_DISEL|nr:Circadian-associated transcriptional repressor [Dissostichus eleginoides]
MNSLGSSSKWPSYDSLSSNSSMLFSESEQTDDEADVFSEGEGDSRGNKSLSGDERITRCPEKTKHPVSSPADATLGSSPATPGDLAFAQKVRDLRRFICPLVELLHGLKTGRFDKGLSSFQQSVAIDRLQRILGILQRPEMGEKYLQNLLQIEMMLKIWFPRVEFQSKVIPSHTPTPTFRPHWRQNQLHMPVKKRKLSWSDPEDCSKIPTKRTHNQHETAWLRPHLTALPRVFLDHPKNREVQRTKPKNKLRNTRVHSTVAL